MGTEGRRPAGGARPRVRPILFLVVLCFLAFRAAGAGAVSPAPGLSRDEANRSYFTDSRLVSHENETVRLYSDVLRGKTVAITFFFTSCSTVCPPMMAKLADVQVLLGDRLGKDIAIVSISVDPTTDTPEVLADYAKLFGVRPGWLLLTGNEEAIAIVTKKLGNVAGGAEEHSAIILAGNVATGHWMKLAPTASVRTVARQLLLLASEE